MQTDVDIKQLEDKVLDGDTNAMVDLAMILLRNREDTESPAHAFEPDALLQLASQRGNERAKTAIELRRLAGRGES